MAIVAERFVARLGVVRIKYTNDDPTIRVPDPVDLFDLQGGYVTLNNYLVFTHNSLLSIQSWCMYYVVISRLAGPLAIRGQVQFPVPTEIILKHLVE